VVAELDCGPGNIQAPHLLDYTLKEIAPFAYNQGIEDAKTFLTAKLEDLPRHLPSGRIDLPAPPRSQHSQSPHKPLILSH
ncbi:MAG TPA: DUF2164 family protein, partial [Prosthecobacter sp.]|nr:DUF2164 family protein [Prosthecobacter sp.]